MLRHPDIKMPAVDAVSPDETLRLSTSYDESQGITAGQKDDVSDIDLELKDAEVSKLPRMTKVTNLLEDFVNVGKDGRVTAG